MEFETWFLQRLRTQRIKVISPATDKPDQPHMITVSTVQECDFVLEHLCEWNGEADPKARAELGCVFGFDVEYGKKHVVATLQLATSRFSCILQVALFASFPERLRRFLEDERFIKVGVGVHEDAAFIEKSFSIKSQGLMDVALVAIKTGVCKGEYSRFFFF
jgi:uncharacterized membrane protein